MGIVGRVFGILDEEIGEYRDLLAITDRTSAMPSSSRVSLHSSVPSFACTVSPTSPPETTVTMRSPKNAGRVSNQPQPGHSIWRTIRVSPKGVCVLSTLRGGASSFQVSKSILGGIGQTRLT